MSPDIKAEEAISHRSSRSRRSEKGLLTPDNCAVEMAITTFLAKEMTKRNRR